MKLQNAASRSSQTDMVSGLPTALIEGVSVVEVLGVSPGLTILQKKSPKAAIDENRPACYAELIPPGVR